MRAHRAPKAKDVLKLFYCWFDYSQLIELICMKLRYDAENYREYGICVDADKRAEKMIECANFLERASDDMNYVKEFWEEGVEDGYHNEVYRLQSEDLKHALEIIEDNLYDWWD